jgi:adenylate cyclase
MIPGEEDSGKENMPPSSVDLEKLLEQKEYLDELIRKKFTRVITVMFTDMKGSTSMTEMEGDVVSRMVIKKQKDILSASIEKNRGVLVKTMGDGTMSYFENAVSAVRSAVQIHNAIEAHNAKGTGVPIRLRIGLNTGSGIVEKNDVFGDVVNVASRFESIAEAGEIYISESTYNALGEGRDEFYCRFLKTSALKEKKGSFKVFKVFWNQKEIELDRSLPESGAAEEVSAGFSTEEGNIVLQRARDLEEKNELLELFLLCEEYHEKIKPVAEMREKLRRDFGRYGKIETKYCGENAVWFFKEAITMGRVPDADFYISNQAMSRVPIMIGMKGGDGVLEIRSMGSGKVKPVEVEKSNLKENVGADIEYCLGKNGKVIFSVCEDSGSRRLHT